MQHNVKNVQKWSKMSFDLSNMDLDVSEAFYFTKTNDNQFFLDLLMDTKTDKKTNKCRKVTACTQYVYY